MGSLHRMRDVLAPLAAAASSAGIFVDFDGALAPIVADPSQARPVKGAAEVLQDLARVFRVVAVVSGRPVSFLSDRLAVRGVRLVGLYGIEERIGRSLRVLPEAQRARGAVEAAARTLATRLGSDAVIERKGFAISAHFRRSDEPEQRMAAAEPIVRGVAEEQGLVVSQGKLVWELAPDVQTDGKGEVVRRLVDQHGLIAGLAAGDDRGDIAAFEAVGALGTSLRVGVASPEMPVDLREHSDLVVDSPEGLVALLRELRRLVR